MVIITQRQGDDQLMKRCPPIPSNSLLFSLFPVRVGQVGNDLYLDPNSGKVLRFDHFKRKFTEETDKKQVLSDRMDDHRNAVQRAVDSYVAEQFKANKCVAAVYGADNGSITICMSAKNVNLGNFWTGSW
jgi:hypothetical protein